MVLELRTKHAVHTVNMPGYDGFSRYRDRVSAHARTCRDPFREKWINRGGTTQPTLVPESKDSETGVFDP